MGRSDKRADDKLRKVTITENYMPNAAGSCLIEFDNTKIICSASVEERVPPFLKGSGTGWVTGEYGMLPCSTKERVPREGRSRVGGRTHEIQRLIGRSLRAVVDLEALGERTVTVDCDVLQADGGTRCAGIIGASLALVDAGIPMRDMVVACAAGKIDGQIVLDLYDLEDKSGEADVPIAIMPNLGEITLLQMDGKLSKEEFERAMDMAMKACMNLHEKQKDALKNKYLELQKSIDVAGAE